MLAWGTVAVLGETFPAGGVKGETPPRRLPVVPSRTLGGSVGTGRTKGGARAKANTARSQCETGSPRQLEKPVDAASWEIKKAATTQLFAAAISAG